MALRPADIATRTFRLVLFRGYAVAEVDAFLDEVEAELTRQLDERDQLRAQVEAPPTAQAQEAALRTLALAQRTADSTVAEATAEAAELLTGARAEAGRLLAAARQQAQQVEAEVAARREQELADLEGRHRWLQGEVEQLRSFEREYRVRLRAYLETQLDDLGSAPAGEGRGNGVPLPARSSPPGPADA